ncbi:MAG: hypothetical protein K2Y08_04035 [Alphaproteobacteria bacterium]|nr:hypothetical protein [Alphaproteobacteria bacterium]
MFRYILFIICLLNFTPTFAFQGDEDKGYIPLAANRLTSDQEHTDFLKHALNSAANSIMISSYTVAPRRLFEDGIADAIINAAERGVKVYIYYERRPYCSQKNYKYLSRLQNCCERFEEIFNHSKCVLRDKDLVAIGSYNWLSDSSVGSSNFSLVLSGGLALGLNNDVWQGIQFYQSLKHENEQGLRKFLKDSDAFSTGAYQFNPGQFFYTLRTPEAHGILLGEVFEKAQRNVVLFSPFIRLEKLKQTLNGSLLQDLENKKVYTKLVSLPFPCDRTPAEESKISSYLEELQRTYPHFSYVTQPDLHAKTLIADDDLLCEGSFNWLSAVTEIDHDANNFEMSVAIRGDIARELIQTFKGTEFGKAVLTIPLETPSLPSMKEKKHFKGKRDQSPQRKHNSKPLASQVPADFDNIVKTFSGQKFGIQGYCVRFNGGDYLRDIARNILYFPTPEEAKQAAYDVWKK